MLINKLKILYLLKIGIFCYSLQKLELYDDARSANKPRREISGRSSGKAVFTQRKGGRGTSGSICRPAS